MDERYIHLPGNPASQYQNIIGIIGRVSLFQRMFTFYHYGITPGLGPWWPITYHKYFVSFISLKKKRDDQPHLLLPDGGTKQTTCPDVLREDHQRLLSRLGKYWCRYQVQIERQMTHSSSRICALGQPCVSSRRGICPLNCGWRGWCCIIREYRRDGTPRKDGRQSTNPFVLMHLLNITSTKYSPI